VEIRRPSNLSGCALQRLLLQPNSDVPRLAPHAPRGACGRCSRRRLDLGGTQAAGGMDSRGRDLFRGLCDYGEYPGSHRNDHGRAARLSSVRRILPFVGAWLELASAKEADSGLGLTRHACICFFRADGGAKPGLEGPSCSLLVRCAGRPEQRQSACQSRDPIRSTQSIGFGRPRISNCVEHPSRLCRSAGSLFGARIPPGELCVCPPNDGKSIELERKEQPRLRFYGRNVFRDLDKDASTRQGS